MKIFLGMQNMGSLMEDYAAGFRALGHQTFAVVESSYAIVSPDVDMNIAKLVQARFSEKTASEEEKRAYGAHLKKLAWQKALEADICFFIWNTFRPDCSDLPELKRRGKKVVVRFCGSEVREPEVEIQAGQYDEMPTVTNYLSSDLGSLQRRLHYLRMAEAHADLVIGVARMGMRPSMLTGGWLYAAPGLSPHPSQRVAPVILHAPSNTAAKGTHELLSVLDVLRHSGLRFGLKMLQNVPYEQMPSEYASVDIVCNSLHYGGRTVFEGMNAGCVVADYGAGHARKMFARHCVMSMRCMGFTGNAGKLQNLWWAHNDIDGFMQMPLVQIRSDTVMETLAELILDYPRRAKLAAQGPEFVRNQLSPEKRCRQILQYLEDPESDDSRMRLFAYPFFSRVFTPRMDAERIKVYNKGTSLVRSCAWYKEVVKPGCRGGLIF